MAVVASGQRSPEPRAVQIYEGSLGELPKHLLSTPVQHEHCLVAGLPKVMISGLQAEVERSLFELKASRSALSHVHDVTPTKPVKEPLRYVNFTL